MLRPKRGRITLIARLLRAPSGAGPDRARALTESRAGGLMRRIGAAREEDKAQVREDSGG